MTRLHSVCRLFPLVIAVLLAFALPVELSSQGTSTASITGTVTDPTGAVIPGATIELTDPGTGQTYRTVANQVGSYTIANIAPGPGYKETVSHAGFETTVLSGLYMNVGSTRTQNVKLSVGAVTATIAVSAENQTVTLDTTDATVGNNFQVQYMQDLPIMVRDTASGAADAAAGHDQ